MVILINEISTLQYLIYNIWKLKRGNNLEWNNDFDVKALILLLEIFYQQTTANNRWWIMFAIIDKESGMYTIKPDDKT